MDEYRDAASQSPQPPHERSGRGSLKDQDEALLQVLPCNRLRHFACNVMTFSHSYSLLPQSSLVGCYALSANGTHKLDSKPLNEKC